MQAHNIPIFKSWIPEWLARSVIFAVLMTSLFNFALYGRPMSMAGYYGVQPSDVQYAMVLTYASAVTFLALDFRITKYFAPRKYLIIGLTLNSVSSLICFYSKNWGVFLICGLVQGIACALICSIVLNMVFSRLQSTRARVIGYSIFYGAIQIAVPVYAIYSSVLLDVSDFNWLFFGLIVMLVALLFVILITMNSKARFHKKMPLYKVDWIGYLYYLTFSSVAGYILIYGQQLNWFDSTLIVLLTIFFIILLFLFIAREKRLRHPIINLQIFKAKNFIKGLLLLFVFYIFKGTTGLTYGYIEVVLGTDPLHIIPIWLAVILGTAVSMFVTARFILMGVSLIRIIITGFIIMACYYFYMLHFVSSTGETKDFILPLFIYGVSTGVLFVPIVSFMASSAPPKVAFNASMVGIFARFLGFSTSMAVNNYTQLYTRSEANDKVRESITEINPQLSLTLKNIQQAYLNAGNDIYTSKGASNAYLNYFIKEQILIHSTKDYYDVMLVGLLVVIVILIFLPGIQNIVLKLRKGSIPY
ncbi:MFS transporter [Chryseobacterium sp. ISL-6]|uniref:MFS transporter n=1 Tax=Chryseobacterium sp. ISL-6 TaxID=2819143 RepID=UPI001BE70FE2|nr:MFS transporter [Chryseobacterium sp. ISL-6]MBT2619716.1 MFS transporter [Chryseobacterium sp. ISL-6]